MKASYLAATDILTINRVPIGGYERVESSFLGHRIEEPPPCLLCSRWLYNKSE